MPFVLVPLYRAIVGFAVAATLVLGICYVIGAFVGYGLRLIGEAFVRIWRDVRAFERALRDLE